MLLKSSLLTLILRGRPLGHRQSVLTNLITMEDWCCSFLMQDLAARETAGDVVGLSLRAHRGTVRCQVPRRCNQHVRAGNRTAQRGVLRKRRFDGLYGVEVAVLAQEQGP